MEGQFISILEGDMKLKLIQIDCYGMNFGVFGHVAPVPPISLKKQKVLSGSEITQKNLTVRTVRNYITGYR